MSSILRSRFTSCRTSCSTGASSCDATAYATACRSHGSIQDLITIITGPFASLQQSRCPFERLVQLLSAAFLHHRPARSPPQLPGHRCRVCTRLHGWRCAQQRSSNPHTPRSHRRQLNTPYHLDPIADLSLDPCHWRLLAAITWAALNGCSRLDRFCIRAPLSRQSASSRGLGLMRLISFNRGSSTEASYSAPWGSGGPRSGGVARRGLRPPRGRLWRSCTCIQCVQGWLRRSPGGPLAWHPLVLWCRGGHLASLHGMLWLQPPMC